MASANLSITGIKGYNAGWSGWYSVGGGQDVYTGGESGSNIFTTAIRFTVPATTGISSGRSLTFSLWFLKGYYSSTNLTYALTASAPKDGQRTPNGTVIKSGTLSLTNLTPGYKNFSLTLSNLSLPVSGGTYYLYLYNGYWCSFGNQSSYKASGYLSYTPHTKTTGWSISTSSLALGSPLTISLPAATEGNGSNKHWIVYKTSTGQEGTISWPTGFSTSVTWTPSLSLANGIPSATSMTCIIQCDTYASDDTFIGSDTRSVTLTVPNSMVPSCTFSTLTLNDGGKNNLLVKGISTLTASITGISGSYGSSVNSYKFSIESTDGTVHWSTTGNVSGGTLSLTSPTLNIAISGASATKRVRVVLTDSRGRTCTVTKDCTYYNYASPIITGFEAYRVGSSGSTTKDMSGDYLYVYLKTNNITSLVGTNKRTSTLSYSPILSGTTANPSDAWGSNGYKAWFNVSAVQQTLTITYVYSDDYFTTRSTLYVQAASIPLDIAFNGTGIGLGTHAESPNLFDIGFSANIRGNLKVDGGMSDGAWNRDAKDLMLINFSGDDPYNSNTNYDNVVRTEDASTLINSPVTSGPFYAYRKVYPVYAPWSHHSKVFVELKEIFPQKGRIWTQAYDPNNGWGNGWTHPFTNKDVVPISNGGTGATSRAEALLALQAGGSGLTDANTVTPGVYVLETSTCRNAPPEGGYYILCVMRYHHDDAACIQLALHLGSNTLYHRLYVVGQWREWKLEGDADSGWQNASITGSFSLYGSDSVLRYRKIGRIVQVEGTLRPSTTLSGSATNLTIFTLPDGYRPSAAVVTLCQGSGSCHWALTIKTNGEVCFARYSSGGSYTSAGTGTWLPFHHTFMV